MKSLFRTLNRLKMFRWLTEEEFSWVLYDVGNSAFTMLACSLIPIWFKNVAIGNASGQITSDKATAYYSIAISVATVIVALLGPICGALSDHRDKKKIFFATSTALGIIGCILNGFAAGWLIFLIIFVLTRLCYSMSLTIYDSMLNDVTTEERMDKVSSYGYAWGYIGSCIPFAVALVAYILGPDMVGILTERASKLIGFTVTALWWLWVTIPLLKRYRQKNCAEAKDNRAGKAFAKIFRTLKRIVLRDKKVLFFLIAFFLYIDGVGTIIDNCINIGTDLNLDSRSGGASPCHTSRCIRRVACFCRTFKKVQHRKAHPCLHRRVLCRMPLCADIEDASAFRHSCIWRGVLSGVYSVPVPLVLFKNHTG